MTGVTWGGNGRWDLRAPGGDTDNPSNAVLSTGGNAYNLTKVEYTNLIGIVSVKVDPALANINIQGGALDLEGDTTSLGDTSATLTISSNTRHSSCSTLPIS